MRLVALVCLILPLVSLAAPAPVAAQSDARFIDTSATARFPQWIRFRLEVEADAEVVAVELFWQPAGDPALSAAYPDFEPGRRVAIDHQVDMTIHYLPPGVDVVYFWRVTDADGDISESAEASLLYMDEGPVWETRTQGLVTIYWHAGDEDFAGDILEIANRTVERLGQRFGVHADEPIRLVVYGDEQDFDDALPPNSAEWIGGQAHPALNLVVALIEPGAGAEREARRVIPHEVSHLLLHQATENPWNSPPNWLDEGLAVYNQETEDERLRDDLEDAIEDGRLIPVRALNSGFPYDPKRALLSYGESWSIVTYIIEELGDARLAALIAVFREGVSYDQAVERGLGMTVEELDARWKAWLGYDGDRPLDAAPNPGDRPEGIAGDERTELTRGEAAIVLAATGCFALLGLILTVVAIYQFRRIGRGEA